MDELLTLFRAKRDEIGTQALAQALGIKESAVRMISTGHYPNPGKILEKFAKLYIDVVACPYAERIIGREECHNRSTGPKPFGGASKQRWWDACQNCEHKGDK